MAKPSHPPPEDYLPVKPVDYLVLRVLWDGDGHGYGIVQEIAERTDQRVQLVPGNFYAVLRRLLEQGLLRETGDRASPEPGGPRRRYYAITALGKRVAAAEAERMRELVRDAESGRLIRGAK